MEDKQLEELASKSRIESNTIRTKTLKYLGIPILIIFTLTILFGFLESFSVGFEITFYVFLGLIGVFTFIWLMVYWFYYPEPPLFNIVYPEIVNDIFRSKNLFLTYKPYPTNKDDIRKSGFYYPSIAYKLFDQIEFNSRSNHHIRFHQVYVYSSDGKTSTVYLNGIYAIIDVHSRDFQIRHHGRPVGLKSLVRVQEHGRFKVYAPVEERIDFGPVILQLSEILDSIGARDVVIGTYQSRMHVAYSLPRYNRSYRNINTLHINQHQKQMEIDIATLEKIDLVLSSFFK